MTRFAARFVLAIPLVAAAAEPAAGTFREQFPTLSIDSAEKADAALAATSGARDRVEGDYRAASRACVSDVLVSACLDRERDRRRKRLADVEAVELDANRFKRREHAEHLAADRTRREAERSAAEPADAAHRQQSRKEFEARQADAARVAADRARKDAAKAIPRTRQQPVAASKRPAADPAQRAKNAADHASKLREATVHQAEIERRIATKAADRKRRTDDKAAKAAAAAGGSPRP